MNLSIVNVWRFKWLYSCSYYGQTKIIQTIFEKLFFAPKFDAIVMKRCSIDVKISQFYEYGKNPEQFRQFNGVFVVFPL